MPEDVGRGAPDVDAMGGRPVIRLCFQCWGERPGGTRWPGWRPPGSRGPGGSEDSEPLEEVEGPRAGERWG